MDDKEKPIERKYKFLFYLVIALFIMSLTIVGATQRGRAVPSYLASRNEFMKKEQARGLGGKLTLTTKEQQANEIIMSLKHKEVDEGFQNPAKFAPAQHLFDVLKQVRSSGLFKIIEKLPKGAALHGHDTALVTTDYILKNFTYRDNLYAKIDGEEIKLHFYDKPPSNEWKLLRDHREAAGSVTDFDAWLRSKLTLFVDNPREKYTNINVVWSYFYQIFDVLTPIVCYKPIWKDYFYQLLQEFYEDNVMYVEIRGTLPEVYDLDGKIYTPLEIVGFYVEVLQQFKQDHPKFFDAKFIYAPVRGVTRQIVAEYINTAISLKKAYPDFIAGFDLVGQEDSGKPLIYFINQLLSIPDDIDFYFHAGETNWFGTTTDENLIDAILLGTKRIGHGFALLKHPEVLKLVKEHKVGIEVNPISNQVLLLVDDLRNHPAAALFADDYPVVISCDDPSFWEAKGLSYDWYVAFIGIASRDQDLKMLKQLAMNSIQYSGLSTVDKDRAYIVWKAEWDKFIDYVVGLSYLKNNEVTGYGK